jgi:hypothetical protein
MAKTRQQAHELIDRLPSSQLTAVVGLLEVMLEPVSHAIARAPLDDEPETADEGQAVAEAKAWFEKNPQGIAFEEVLADFGLTVDDVRDVKDQA